MAKGYWIAHIDVTDMEGFRDYIPMSTRAIEESGGRFLVRGGSNDRRPKPGLAHHATPPHS